MQFSGDKRVVVDGPFVETKEQLTGYFLSTAKDLDEATCVATQIPGGRIGTVEVCPIRDIIGLPAS